MPIFQLTGSAFTCLARDLLQEGYKYVLSEKLLCQDSVEQYFAAQRQCGGSVNAPTTSAYLNQAVVMKTTKQVSLPVRTGNCRGGVGTNTKALSVDDTPMVVRKRARREP